MEQFIALIRQWIDKAIYVWGGQGEPTSEADIRRRETSTANADRAIALYRKRQAQGIDPVIKFDCSGLVIWALQTMGLISYDTTADGIYDKCAKITKSNLRIGDFTFRVRSDGNAHHIGIVTKSVNGVLYVTEARGRDYGVIENPIDQLPGYWETFGKNPFIKEEEMLSKGSKGEAVKAWQESLLNAGYALPKYGADADFGGETEAATNLFKAAQGLPQDGVVNDITWGKMALLAKPSKELEDKVTFLTNEVFASQQRVVALQSAVQTVEQERDNYRNELVTLSGIIKKY